MATEEKNEETTEEKSESSESNENSKSKELEIEKRWKDDNGMEHSMRIEKVINGYIITESKYGKKDGKYINERKRRISSTFPEEKKSLLEALENIDIKNV